MSDLALLIPSKDRPHNIKRLLPRIPDEVAVYIGIPSCSEEDVVNAYLDLISLHPQYVVIPIPDSIPAGANGALNYMSNLGHHRWYGFMGDDHLPEQGWYPRVQAGMATLEESHGAGILYGDDGFQGEALPTAVFMSSVISRALGWMAPECLHHLYMDNFWHDLGSALGILKYDPDLKITHMHPGAKKAEWDATYEAANAPNIHRDADYYYLYKLYDFDNDVAHLRKYIH